MVWLDRWGIAKIKPTQRMLDLADKAHNVADELEYRDKYMAQDARNLARALEAGTISYDDALTEARNIGF